METTFETLSSYEAVGFYDTKSQMRDYIYKRSQKLFSAGRKARADIKNTVQLKERQAEVRKVFFNALGGVPNSPEKIRHVDCGTVDFGSFTVEKIMYESRRDCYIPANLYKPKGSDAAYPAVLFLCGHDSKAKHSEEYQKVCRHLVKKGLMVFVVDPIGQGERLSYYGKGSNDEWGTAEHSRAGLQCLMTGKPIARYFLHDAVRAVDYLLMRQDVDKERIAVTGNSGGGTQTAMMMLADSRIAAAAPATFITTRERNLWTGLAQDSEQCWPGMLANCGFDHQDFLLAFAPKPLILAAAAYDFFPYEGTLEAFETGKRFWAMHGREELLKMYTDKCTHKYTENMAEAVGNFFTEVFNVKTKETDVPDKYTVSQYTHLLCTAQGQINSAHYPNKIVFSENLELFQSLPQAENFKAWISERIFKGRCITALNPRLINDFVLSEEGLKAKNLYWFTQENLLGHAFVFLKKNLSLETAPVTICVWQDGTKDILGHKDLIQEICAQNRCVLVLNTTGTGALEPSPVNTRDIHAMFGTLYKFADDLNWIGDSICALRSFDVIRCIEMLRCSALFNENNYELYAEGVQGIYAYNAGKALGDKFEIPFVWEKRPVELTGICKEMLYDTNRVWEYIIPGMAEFYGKKEI